jgi:NAD(P)-dependent dehydrogenase (short-subunit alcohol dehydrogenase family)
VSYDIGGKTVLVTGANRGIGKALVETFLQHGAGKVYAAVRAVDSAAPLVEAHGDKVVPVPVDLADAGAISRAAETASDVDVVVNNAGVLTTTGPLDSDAAKSLDFELKVNVFGLLHMAQAFAPVLKNNGGGVFVQLNSVVSFKSFPNFTTYSASKAAAYSLTQALREVLGAQGTTVLSVHPGPIATDMGDAAGLTDIAEPASLVGEAIIRALEDGEFHVFPDSMARQFQAAYDSFAKNVIEASAAEG